MGRRTKLNSMTHNLLVDAVRVGTPYDKAAAAAGITATTLYNWLAKGRLGRSPYREFLEDIEKAEAHAQIEALTVIRKAAVGIAAQRDKNGDIIAPAVPGQWTAAAWYLERKYPDQFGRRMRVESKSEVTHTVEQPEGLDDALGELRARLLGMRERLTQAESYTDA